MRDDGRAGDCPGVAEILGGDAMPEAERLLAEDRPLAAGWADGHRERGDRHQGQEEQGAHCTDTPFRLSSAAAIH